MKKLIFFIFISFLALLSHSKNILIVRDGCSHNVFSYYVERMNIVDYQVKNTEKESIQTGSLNNYDIVLWLCGNNENSLNNNEKNIIQDYLKNRKDASLFIEGDFLFCDNDIIERLFYKKNKLNKKNVKSEISEDLNPITLGLERFFKIKTDYSVNIDEFSPVKKNAVVFQTGEKKGNKRESDYIGIGIDNYSSRVIMLSFSPATRNIWEIDISPLVNNIINWLSVNTKESIDRILNNTFDISKAGLAFSRIVTALNSGEYKEFDKLMYFCKIGKINQEYYSYIISRLEEKYFSDKDWRKNSEISKRIKNTVLSFAASK